MRRCLRSSEHVKIARFFFDNPNSIDTPRGVAAWTNISLAETRRILEELARNGILIAYRTSSTVGYSLQEDTKLLKHLGQELRKHS